MTPGQPLKHRDAQWFAEQVARFIAPDKRIHPRGVFYACVVAGDMVKPDGEAFANTAENEAFVNAAARCARWLGYVPFERLVDSTTMNPSSARLRRTMFRQPTSGRTISPSRRLTPTLWGVLAARLRATSTLPASLLRREDMARRRARPARRGVRRRSLPHVGPDRRERICTAWRGTRVADGRPLVVLTFSDFDPAGYWDMPTCMGRKLQALRDLLFPELRFTVVHAALGPEQVRELDLPSSPLKSGEKRAAKWLELYS